MAAQPTYAQLQAKVRTLERKSKVGWAMFYQQVDMVREWDTQMKGVLEGITLLNEEQKLAHLKKGYLDMLERLHEYTDCPICLETLNRGNTAVPNCGHLLCKGCFADERLNKCPLCRKAYRYKPPQAAAGGAEVNNDFEGV